MKNLNLLFSLLLLSTCSFLMPASASTLEKVEHVGALKNFMHENDISPKINLQELADRKHLYALGAVGNLKGEIIILDSKPLVTTVIDNKVVMDRSFNHSASLLVYTQVNRWKENSTPDSKMNFSELESYIEKSAKSAGIDTEKPFPFMIKGRAKSAAWHVIDWDENDTVHTHEKHKTAGAHGKIMNEKVVILGFFSKHHTGIFNHHSTNMHLHIKSGENISGHVDELTLGGKNILLLPAIN